MSIINSYIEYLKDNPNGYWFKRKLYGWGWTPASWQGWAVTLLYLALLIGLALTIDESAPANELALMLFLPLILLTATLIAICYKTGEKPKWTWGLPKKDE